MRRVTDSGAITSTNHHPHKLASLLLAKLSKC